MSSTETNANVNSTMIITNFWTANGITVSMNKVNVVDQPISQQQFCVRWNSHLGSLGAAFPELLAGQLFVDVTLASDGHQLHCHRLVLAACSSYFEQLLIDNPCKHPIIILPHDIRLWEIQALVDFMYKGEVNVSQEGLPSLLRCAEILQIRGLCGADAALNVQQATHGVLQEFLGASESSSTIPNVTTEPTLNQIKNTRQKIRVQSRSLSPPLSSMPSINRKSAAAGYVPGSTASSSSSSTSTSLAKQQGNRSSSSITDTATEATQPAMSAPQAAHNARQNDSTTTTTASISQLPSKSNSLAQKISIPMPIKNLRLAAAAARYAENNKPQTQSLYKRSSNSPIIDDISRVKTPKTEFPSEIISSTPKVFHQPSKFEQSDDDDDIEDEGDHNRTADDIKVEADKHAKRTTASTSTLYSQECAVATVKLTTITTNTATVTSPNILIAETIMSSSTSQATTQYHRDVLVTSAEKLLIAAEQIIIGKMPDGLSSSSLSSSPSLLLSLPTTAVANAILNDHDYYEHRSISFNTNSNNNDRSDNNQGNTDDDYDDDDENDENNSNDNDDRRIMNDEYSDDDENNSNDNDYRRIMNDEYSDESEYYDNVIIINNDGNIVAPDDSINVEYDDDGFYATDIDIVGFHNNVVAAEKNPIILAANDDDSDDDMEDEDNDNDNYDSEDDDGIEGGDGEYAENDAAYDTDDKEDRRDTDRDNDNNSLNNDNNNDGNNDNDDNSKTDDNTTNVTKQKNNIDPQPIVIDSSTDDDDDNKLDNNNQNQGLNENDQLPLSITSGGIGEASTNIGRQQQQQQQQLNAKQQVLRACRLKCKRQKQKIKLKLREQFMEQLQKQRWQQRKQHVRQQRRQNRCQQLELQRYRRVYDERVAQIEHQYFRIFDMMIRDLIQRGEYLQQIPNLDPHLYCLLQLYLQINLFRQQPNIICYQQLPNIDQRLHQQANFVHRFVPQQPYVDYRLVQQQPYIDGRLEQQQPYLDYRLEQQPNPEYRRDQQQLYLDHRLEQQPNPEYRRDQQQPYLDDRLEQQPNAEYRRDQQQPYLDHRLEQQPNPEHRRDQQQTSTDHQLDRQQPNLDIDSHQHHLPNIDISDSSISTSPDIDVPMPIEPLTQPEFIESYLLNRYDPNFRNDATQQYIPDTIQQQTSIPNPNHQQQQQQQQQQNQTLPTRNYQMPTIHSAHSLAPDGSSMATVYYGGHDCTVSNSLERCSHSGYCRSNRPSCLRYSHAPTPVPYHSSTSEVYRLQTSSQKSVDVSSSSSSANNNASFPMTRINLTDDIAAINYDDNGALEDDAAERHYCSNTEHRMAHDVKDRTIVLTRPCKCPFSNNEVTELCYIDIEGAAKNMEHGFEDNDWQRVTLYRHQILSLLYEIQHVLQHKPQRANSVVKDFYEVLMIVDNALPSGAFDISTNDEMPSRLEDIREISMTLSARQLESLIRTILLELQKFRFCAVPEICVVIKQWILRYYKNNLRVDLVPSEGPRNDTVSARNSANVGYNSDGRTVCLDSGGSHTVESTSYGYSDSGTSTSATNTSNGTININSNQQSTPINNQQQTADNNSNIYESMSDNNFVPLPSQVVLRSPRSNQPRTYTQSQLYAALMDVKAGDSIYRASQHYNVPRKTLRNWMKRLQIKSAYPMPRQLKQVAEKKRLLKNSQRHTAAISVKLK